MKFLIILHLRISSTVEKTKDLDENYKLVLILVIRKRLSILNLLFCRVWGARRYTPPDRDRDVYQRVGIARFDWNIRVNSGNLLPY